uniref:Uncharacterized protein n=1 Tax=Knipowitschia caucasica TaxID=637954 RepID=A0AAV2K8H6_KNICA
MSRVKSGGTAWGPKLRWGLTRRWGGVVVAPVSPYIIWWDWWLGTLISAFTVLCGARSDLISERGKCCVFWLNVVAALIQILTAVLMVGWIMSIFWGMDMVILAISDGCRDQGVPQEV